MASVRLFFITNNGITYLTTMLGENEIRDRMTRDSVEVSDINHASQKENKYCNLRNVTLAIE